jgi:RNA polymerase sigma factor (sigma-70 family)
VSNLARDDARTAFEQLFRETRDDLLAYVVRRSESAEDAADVLAETYLIAWRRLEAIPQGERARLWLFGVARNLLLKGASRGRSRDSLVKRLAGELRSAQPTNASVDDHRSAALASALASLPERDREILTLTAWEGLTPKQIAAVIGTSVNVVRVRLHRARARLKRDLSDGRINDPSAQSIEAVRACPPKGLAPRRQT